MMKLHFNPNWNKVIRRFERVQSAKIIERGLTLWGADLMVKEAQEQIDRLVYLAPAPPSAAGHETEYLAHNRTNRTRKAIRRERLTGGSTNMTKAQAKVDKSFYDFYYARVLNWGGRPGGRLANYRPRPFWTNALTVVRAAWKAKGLIVRGEVVNDLRRD